MGSLVPSSAASSASSAMDNWFFNSASADHLLTQALTRELCSTSASSSSSSIHSLELSPHFAQSNKCSDSLLHPQAQSNLSQVGSPLSSNSVCKEPPESPFNYSNGSSVFNRMSTTATASSNRVSASCVTNHHQAPQRLYNKAPQAMGALSSLAAAGAVASKVSKRRPRSNKKAPIAVLTADTSNFRAMVQQLTGIPTPQALPPLWSHCGVPLLKPQPTRISPLDLTTLDTSSSFFAPKMNSFLRTDHYHPNVMDLDALLALSSGSMGTRLSPVQATANFCATEGFKHPSSASMAKEGGHCTVAGLSSTSIENFLMDDEEHNPKVSYSTIDSWLAFDGGAISNYSPRVEFTKVVS